MPGRKKTSRPLFVQVGSIGPGRYAWITADGMLKMRGTPEEVDAFWKAFAKRDGPALLRRVVTANREFIEAAMRQTEVDAKDRRNPHVFRGRTSPSPMTLLKAWRHASDNLSLVIQAAERRAFENGAWNQRHANACLTPFLHDLDGRSCWWPDDVDRLHRCEVPTLARGVGQHFLDQTALVRKGEAYLVFQYPFSQPYRMPLKRDTYTVRQLVQAIRQGFEHMYKGVQLKRIGNLLNRGGTSPKFGRTNHGPEDLVFTGLTACKKKSKTGAATKTWTEYHVEVDS